MALTPEESIHVISRTMEGFKKGLLLLTALLWALPSLAQEPFDPVSLLRGSSPSVLVSGGENLSVVLRGGGSLRGDSQPLWIVDGVEINPSVTYLNIYDITDIRVLTDLSETAAYGNRGANGVVLVTTGAPIGDDKFRIRWNSDAGVSFPTEKLQGTGPGFNHNHHLSLSGKSIRANYGVSLWARQTDGILPGDNGTAGGIRTRFEMRAGKVLSFGMNTAFVMGEKNTMPYDGPFDGWEEDYDNETQSKRLTSAVFIAANFSNTLKLKLNLGCDLDNSDRYIWYGDKTALGHEHNGYATIEGNTDFGYNADLNLSWNRFFAGKHRVNLEGDLDAHGLKTKRGSMSGDDFFTHTLRARGLNLYNGDPDIRKYSFDSFSWGGYFRAGYELEGIAGVNAMLRADLTPRYDTAPQLYKNADLWFNPGKAFFPDGKAVSGLKLSASYGEAGREKALPYLTYGDFLMGEYPSVQDNIQMFYEGLWRLRSREITAGLDLGFLSDRIRLGARFFDRTSDDNFYAWCFGKKEGYYWETAEPSEHFTRTATVRSRGVEGELKAAIISGERFSWDIFAGMAWNVSRIFAIGDDEVSSVKANVLGYPAGSFYGFKTDENGQAIDITGDGVVNRFDRQVTGSPMPEYYGSFGTHFRYGNFSMDLLGSWATGFDVMDKDMVLKKGDYLRLSRARAAYRFSPVTVSLSAYDCYPFGEMVLLGVSLTFGRK